MNENELLTTASENENRDNRELSVDETVSETQQNEENKIDIKQRLSDWWHTHKPTKRRLIQIYAALLYNANIRGYITGEIFKGATKVVCVPGLNCYSCPGAIGACPLGALQNALASSDKRAPYYMIGIILLYGLILGRMICGFLCPVGLAQDLLYKIKTPKIGKGKITRVLSYFKYVILIFLVIGIPIIYATDQIAVPGFCKYICPAGTFGGAFMLLVNKNNSSMFSMLGPLFTWKAVVLFAVIALCVFLYRAFCRFLCPLGAIYGLFNRFSLLGISVNEDKCISCGKCVSHCKVDIKRVGDHECINCGECAGVCPTKAIVWKGGKLLVNNIDGSVAAAHNVPKAETFSAPSADAVPACRPLNVNPVKTVGKRDRAFWLRLTAIILMAALFIGVFTYANFFAAGASAESTATYVMYADTSDGSTGILSFTLGGGDKPIIPSSGSGTREDPFIIDSVVGRYEPVITTSGEGVYFRFTIDKAAVLSVDSAADNLRLNLFYLMGGVRYITYSFEENGSEISLSLDRPTADGDAILGNEPGYTCYDFTLSEVIGGKPVTLSDYRGKTVIVNFWGTWCGPCVAELPEFEKVRAEHSDVELIAVHSVLGQKDAENFLITKGWTEWGAIFVKDTGTADNSELFTLLGGRNGAYPRTLVIDGEGIVRYVFEGSVSEQTLASAIEEILEI